MTAHIILKFKGSAEKILAFHYLASKLDLDYPWGPFRRNVKENLHCKKCKGYIYKNPTLKPDELRKLAHQVSESVRMSGTLKLKIVKFTKNSKCEEAA